MGAVTASDTVHQALITHSSKYAACFVQHLSHNLTSVQVYWYLVTEYGNPDSLAKLVKSIVVEVIFQCITGFLVQR